MYSSIGIALRQRLQWKARTAGSGAGGLGTKSVCAAQAILIQTTCPSIFIQLKKIPDLSPESFQIKNSKEPLKKEI